MTKFYEGLETQGPAAALQMAQRYMRECNEHPYYWASFIMVGC
jgi:CHAT domain-containing protein